MLPVEWSFFDISNPNCQPTTPSPQHYLSIQMGDVDLHLLSAWEKCLDEDVPLPASFLRTYAMNGDARSSRINTHLASCAPTD